MAGFTVSREGADDFELARRFRAELTRQSDNNHSRQLMGIRRPPRVVVAVPRGLPFDGCSRVACKVRQREDGPYK